MPLTGLQIGTPASMSDGVEPHTEPIEDDPFELERLRDDPNRVRELIRGRDHRLEGPLASTP